MPRLFTPRQEAANATFLAALARTGNTRLAARELGVHRSTYFKRRAKSQTFAAQWDQALTTAHKALRKSSPAFAGSPGRILPRRILDPAGQGQLGDGDRAKSPGRHVPRTRLHSAGHCAPGDGGGANSSPALAGEGDRARRGGGAGRRPNLKTQGGEPQIIRQKSGRLQLRQSPPGRITAAAEQVFFRTLSATANIRFAAEAAGFAHTSFLYRKRRSRRFAAEARRCVIRARAAIARAAATRAHLAHLRAHPQTGWPAELTVARALRVLRSPPLKLPCTPFPKKRHP